MDPTVGAVLGALIAAILGGGFATYFRAASQNRVDDAKADLDEATGQVTAADAVSRWQALYDDLLGRVETMESQASELRDAARAAAADAATARVEASRARADKAEAETRVAELEADLARALKEAGEERHSLRNELAAATARVVTLERLVDELRAEIDGKGRAGDLDRRQIGGRRDGDLTV